MRSLTIDAQKRKQKTLKGKFKPSPAAERAFLKQLKKVAKASAGIITSHVDVDGVVIENLPQMQKQLEA